MNGTFILLLATAGAVCLPLLLARNRRLAVWREGLRFRREFRALTRSASLDFRWSDRIGINRGHLYLVGGFDLNVDGAEPGYLPPSRFRLDQLEAISQKIVEGSPLLIVTLRGPKGRSIKAGLFLPDQLALDEIYGAIHQRGLAYREEKEKQAFDVLLAGATLDYRWRNEIGTDEQWLYGMHFQPVGNDDRPGDYLPPTRFRLRDLARISQMSTSTEAFLVLSVNDPKGDRTRVCRAFPDQAELAKVHDEIAARIFPPEPATSANAPTPLAALLRTIAAREIDARRFLKRLETLDPEVDTAMWKLRECAEPEAVFMIEWKGEPGREERFARLFAAWNRTVTFSDTEGNDMPAFLRMVRDAAPRLGLQLWSIDTRSDFYQGFLAPTEAEARVRELCQACGIEVYG